MRFLPEHLEHARSWLDHVEQIVIVDSESEDGTVEYFRGFFADRPVTILSHPPGLYQSWNHGLAALTTRYAYVSTIGDHITLEGLSHLCDVAERHHADAVVSPPQFITENGAKQQGNLWPVHSIIEALGIKEPFCMEGLLTFAVALSYLPFALLGSSASNLYRTTTLQQRPFESCFGMNGDGAWSIANALAVRIAITPRCFSTFRKHRKHYSLEPYAVADLDQKIMAMGLQVLERALANEPKWREEAAAIGLNQLIEAKRAVQRWRLAVMEYRGWLWPWILNPLAWHARHQRVAAQARCTARVNEILRSHYMQAPCSPV